LARRCLSSGNFSCRIPISGGARRNDFRHSNLLDDGLLRPHRSCLGCGICVGDTILCCYLLAGKSHRVFLDLAGPLLRGVVLLLGATLVATIVPLRTLLLRERVEAEGSFPSGIIVGKGFRNLSMEMEALQERCPASSVSGTREQEVERRMKARI
jgi:hypothetical protein